MITANVTCILRKLRQLCPSTLRALGLCLLMFGLWSCDASEEPENSGSSAYISMLLNTGAHDLGSSRSDGATSWDDPYNGENGTEIENRIDPRKIHIFLYQSNGTPIGVIRSTGNNPKVKIYHFTNNPGLYQIIFDASDMGLTKGRDYMAAVVVNIDGNFNDNSLDNLTFNNLTLTGVANPADGPDYYSAGLLPMFGFMRWTMGTIDQLTGQMNGFPSVGTVNLLRSVTKIEVVLSDDFDRHPNARYMTFDLTRKPHLADAGSHINNLGYVTPLSAIWKTKNGTKNLTFEESFTENTTSRFGSATTDVYFHATGNNGRMFYIYLPEASGKSMYPNEEPLRLNVTVNFNKPAEGDNLAIDRTVTGTLFPSIPYDAQTGLPQGGADYNNWKLVRNHIYRFTLTDCLNEVALKYEVSEGGEKNIYVPEFD